MPPRLPTQGFSSFFALNCCVRQTPGSQTRTLFLYRSKLPRRKSLSLGSRNFIDKRYLHATIPCAAGPKNPYQVLGVQPDATAAEIKKTYFALARKYHPDTNPDKGARDKFVEIQEAYDILKDEKKRATFDQYGASSQAPGFDPNAFAGFGQGGFSGFQFEGQGGDLFEQLFGSFTEGGGRSRSTAGSRGDDVETTLKINFLEACKGAKKKVTINPVADCTSCSATGLKEGVQRKTCSTCGGSGTRTFVIQGGFHMASTCVACAGAGSSIPRGGECPSCKGVGKVRTKESFTVDIPVGAEEGMTIRIPNAGDVPLVKKGPRGDLFIRLNVTPSSVFTRQGSNLYYQARIPFHKALLGGIVRVPTLDGEVDVRVPAGTQQGEEMVLKSRGVKVMRGIGSGDLLVKFSLLLPRTLSDRQRSLLEAYADDVEKRNSSTQAPKDSDQATKDPKQTAKSSEEPLSVENDSPVPPSNDALEKETFSEDSKETMAKGKRATG